jgi:hypothetical protein
MEVMEPELQEAVRHLISELRTSAQQQCQELVGNLPRLQEADVISLGHQDSVCPICFTPVLALLAEEETALVMDSPAHPQEELGVTRLAQPWQCGHLFCRRDISQWIRGGHDSCPTCRRPLVAPNAHSDSARANEPDDSEDTWALFEELTVLHTPGSSIANNIASDPDDGNRDYVGMYS